MSLAIEIHFLIFICHHPPAHSNLLIYTHSLADTAYDFVCKSMSAITNEKLFDFHLGSRVQRRLITKLAAIREVDIFYSNLQNYLPLRNSCVTAVQHQPYCCERVRLPLRSGKKKHPFVTQKNSFPQEEVPIIFHLAEISFQNLPRISTNIYCYHHSILI